MKMLKLVALILVLLPVAIVIGAQFGLLAGHVPDGLGVRDGRLKPPGTHPNSVSSQASLYPTHPRHVDAQVAPLAFQGNPTAAMKKLENLVAAMPGSNVVKREARYLHVECSSRWLKFTDDLEFYLDESAGVIHVRSASRLGRRDFGVNRERVEAIRKAFPA